MSVRIKRQGNRKHFGNSVLEKKIQHWRVNLVLGIENPLCMRFSLSQLYSNTISQTHRSMQIV